MNLRGTTSQRLLQLALVALMLRALVPAGMMAAPVADGWPFKLCPSGMSMPSYMALIGAPQSLERGIASHSDHSDHAAHADHSQHAEHADSEGDQLCGLSAGFSAVAQAIDFQPSSTDLSVLPRLNRLGLNLARAPPRAHRSRAPPVFS